MSWVWFDVCPAPTAEPVLASAPVWADDGRTAGVLCAWAGDRPHTRSSGFGHPAGR